MREEVEQISRVTGVTQRNLKNILKKDSDPKFLKLFLSAGPKELQDSLFNSDEEGTYWITPAKRYVQSMEIQRVLSYFLRSSTWPESSRAIILTGPNPLRACIPWVASGIIYSIDGYEMNRNVFLTYPKPKVLEEKFQLMIEKGKFWGAKPEVKVRLYNNSCFKRSSQEKSSVIDLDFCANRIRTIEQRQELVKFVSDNMCKGPCILRVTSHIGRGGNSRDDIDNQIRALEGKLRDVGFDIEEKQKNFYQSLLPMLSLLYILKHN